MFFSCCSVFRLITLCPSPWLFLALLISSLLLLRSVSSLLSLSLSGTPLFVCVVWVCANGREFVHQPPIGWRRPARIGCTLCRVSERTGRWGENSRRLGSGESRDGVRGCFCFEMAGFEIGRRTSQLARQWRTELIGCDSTAVSPLAKASAILFFFSCSAMCSCASLLSPPAARAARAPKCSPPLALRV